MLSLIALAFLSACGPAGVSDDVRCQLQDGGPSTVVCSCAVSCVVRPDLLIDAVLLDGCGVTECHQDQHQPLLPGAAS